MRQLFYSPLNENNLVLFHLCWTEIELKGNKSLQIFFSWLQSGQNLAEIYSKKRWGGFRIIWKTLIGTVAINQVKLVSYLFSFLNHTSFIARVIRVLFYLHGANNFCKIILQTAKIEMQPNTVLFFSKTGLRKTFLAKELFVSRNNTSLATQNIGQANACIIGKCFWVKWKCEFLIYFRYCSWRCSWRLVSICGGQPLKNLKWYGLLRQTISIRVF